MNIHNDASRESSTCHDCDRQGKFANAYTHTHQLIPATSDAIFRFPQLVHSLSSVFGASRCSIVFAQLRVMITTHISPRRRRRRRLVAPMIHNKSGAVDAVAAVPSSLQHPAAAAAVAVLTFQQSANRLRFQCAFRSRKCIIVSRRRVVCPVVFVASDLHRRIFSHLCDTIDKPRKLQRFVVLC